MRIGIDARLVTYRRGIGNIVYNLLRALAEEPAAYEFILYVDNPNATKFVPDDSRFVLKLVRPNLYPVWEQVVLPIQVWHDRLDVLHCPANAAPLLLPKTTRLVLTVADVMYVLPRTTIPTPPSLYQRIGRQYLKLVVPHAVRNAAAVTTISHYSQSDISKHLAIDQSRIAVIYLAPGPEFRKLSNASCQGTAERLGLTKRFMVSLGALDPRKNTARVIDAFAQFIATTKCDYQLIIVGLTPAAQRHFSEQVRKLDVRDRVILAGFVAEDELVALFNLAEMMLYPSLYEGFGLPLLEAMACGTPVIGSSAASIPEIAGDAALLIDPTDTFALVQAMTRLSHDHALRDGLINRGFQHITNFSWGKAAQQMLTIYAGVMNE